MNFVRLTGIVPFGIGLTVLGFLWGTPFGEFHSPPLFFRIFGSFIALGFVMTGAAALFGKLPEHLRDPHSLLRPPQTGSQRPSTPVNPADATYACPNCGSTLGRNADVSPLGDVKCTQCARWFNIHASQA